MQNNGIFKIYINGRFLTQSITGVQRYAHELVKALDYLLETGEIDRARYNFEMLAPQKGIKYDLGLKHIKVRQVGRLTGHAWEQFELPGFSRDGALFCPGNTAPAGSLLSKQKTVVTVHDLSYLYFPDAYSFAFRTFYNFIIPLIMKYSDRIITVSESERSSILKHYKFAADRLTAIQNGGLAKNYLDEISNMEGAASERPFVLYVGSLSRRKNLQGVIEAVALLNKQEDVPAVVVGAGGKSFRNDQFGVPQEAVKKVDFKGQINDTRYILQLYKSAACLVFPSFYEASPLPPIEAMACGCPVIVSPIPSLLERCGDAGLYCNPDEPADIADKIKMVLNDPSLAENLKTKGFERAGQFTWENCARQTWEVILSTLD